LTYYFHANHINNQPMRCLYLFGLKKARLQNLQSKVILKFVMPEKKKDFLFWRHSSFCSFARLPFIYLPSCFGQETAKWSLRCSSQAATC